LGPGGALYGERARASRQARGASPVRICRLRHRDPVSRSCRPDAAVAPPVLLPPPRGRGERSGLQTGVSEPQRLVHYNPAIPIETFDLIITDECDRSIYGTWR